MKFKIGDRVRVFKSDPTWLFWGTEMNPLVGQAHTIVGEWISCFGTYPTIIVNGHHLGLSGKGRRRGEYAFPEHCLELAPKPGEQLEFAFMYAG